MMMNSHAVGVFKEAPSAAFKEAPRFSGLVLRTITGQHALVGRATSVAITLTGDNDRQLAADEVRIRETNARMLGCENETVYEFRNEKIGDLSRRLAAGEDVSAEMGPALAEVLEGIDPANVALREKYLVQITGKRRDERQSDEEKARYLDWYRKSVAGAVKNAEAQRWELAEEKQPLPVVARVFSALESVAWLFGFEMNHPATALPSPLLGEPVKELFYRGSSGMPAVVFEYPDETLTGLL